MEKDKLYACKDGRKGNSGRTLQIKYQTESKLLRHVLSAHELSRVCIRAEQRIASRRSSFATAAGKWTQPLLAYPAKYLKEVILVGSSAEGLKLNFYRSPKANGDTDWIFLGQQFVICESKTSALSTSLKAPTVLMEENANLPGYVKLKVPQHLTDHEDYKGFTETFKDGVFLTGKKHIEKCIGFLSSCSKNIETHGPAVTYTFDNNAAEKLIHAWVSGYTREKDYQKPSLAVCREQNYSADLVFCHYYDGWPQQANNWIFRNSSSIWPSNHLKEHCMAQGCILAPVSPKDSPKSDILWRISFNQAEQRLIESFNETQFHCLVMLKILKTEMMDKIPGKNITSYILKTAMFWCMEEINQNEWRPDNLIQCVVACLELLQKWISDRFMPNYFIERRNMFALSELTESIRNQILLVIETVIANPWQEIKTTGPLQDMIKKEETELALWGARKDISLCMSVRTNTTMGQFLCQSLCQADCASNQSLTTNLAAELTASPVASQTVVYSELAKHVLAVMYNVKSMTKLDEQLPGDCLGIIANYVTSSLSKEQVARKYFELHYKVWNENNFEILDECRKILWNDLIEGDIRKTIESLRTVGFQDDDLGLVLAAHLDILDCIVRNK